MSIQPIVVNNKELGLSSYHSSLKTDYAAGVGVVGLYSITQFAVDQILGIGEYGAQGSEIIKTHHTTTPSGGNVTLAANTVKPHPKDTQVYIYAFDQIEFSWCATLTGAKSVLLLTNIDPAQDTMVFNDTANTSGFYFTRYKNSITGIFSDYSDGIPYSGLPTNTVGYAIDTAMNELNANFSSILTFGMMIGFAKQMLRLVRGKLMSWAKYQEYDYLVGTMTQGQRRIAVPATLYDKNSNRSVLQVRVGNGDPLTPLDKNSYQSQVSDAVYTEVATQPIIGATSLVLKDSSNLDDSGTLDVFVSGTKYTVTYTANNRATETLTIPATGTGSITYAFPVNSPCWDNANYDTPEFFAVFDGYLYVWPMVDSTSEGRDILMDFFTDIETVENQMDVISGTKFDMLIPYLKYKVRAITENNGKEDLKDPSYAEFRELLGDAIKNDSGAERRGFRPRRKLYNTRSDNYPQQ